MASTDDIFTALNEDSSDVAVTEQDRPLPSLDIDVASADLSEPQPLDSAAPPYDFATSSTEEILLADEVLPEPVDPGLPGLDSDSNGVHDDMLEGETVSGSIPEELSKAVHGALAASTMAPISQVPLPPPPEPAAIAAGASLQGPPAKRMTPDALMPGMLTRPDSPVIPPPRAARDPESITDDLPNKKDARLAPLMERRATSHTMDTELQVEAPQGAEPSWGDLINSDSPAPAARIVEEEDVSATETNGHSTDPSLRALI
ncbi:MAG: hypothetical protein AAGK78_17275, partial [Planctomycetota bacterium]